MGARADLMAPSLSHSVRNSSVFGMVKKVPDGAVMVAATLAALLGVAFQTRLPPSFPAALG